MPRPVLRGSLYLITRRCSERRFFLRPDAEVNEAFLYCLAEAAARFGVEVILVVAMSNHYHAVVYDRCGLLPRFTEHFHKLLARTINAIRGRDENMWSSDQVSVVRLEGREDLLDKLAYTATNPVKDHLVERAHQWPGVQGLPALLNGRTLVARRPRRYFRRMGRMPASVKLRLHVPAEIEDGAGLLEALRAEVARRERAAAAERARTGRRIVGCRAVQRQRWRDAPTTPSPRGGIKPRIAARNRWARIEALRRNRAFLEAYQAARQLWRAGELATFPPGTYWLSRFSGVRVADASATPQPS